MGNKTTASAYHGWSTIINHVFGWNIIFLEISDDFFETCLAFSVCFMTSDKKEFPLRVHYHPKIKYSPIK